jgi:hypothetical protein
LTFEGIGRLLFLCLLIGVQRRLPGLDPALLVGRAISLEYIGNAAGDLMRQTVLLILSGFVGGRFVISLLLIGSRLGGSRRVVFLFFSFSYGTRSCAPLDRQN